MRLILAVLLGLAVAGCAGSSNGGPGAPTATSSTITVSGRVTNSVDGSAIVGATIAVADGPNSGKSATSDASGHFVMGALQPSTATFSVSASGFVTQSIGLSIAADQTVDLHLDPVSTSAPAPSCDYLLSLSGTIEGYPSGAAIPLTVTTTSSCAWSVTTSASWIHVQPASGTGSASLTITLDGNADGPPRTGSFTIADKSVTINQTSLCSYAVSPATSIAVDGSGATVVVNVTTTGACGWDVTSSAPWIHVSPASTSGSGVATLSADANRSTSARSAVVTIAGQAVTVNQSRFFPTSYTFSLTATSGPLSGQSASGEFAFDPAIVPTGGGQVILPHFTAFSFSWDGVQYDQNNTQVSQLQIDTSGGLTSWEFGTACIAPSNGGCVVRLSGGTRDWEVKPSVGFEYGRPDKTFGFGAVSVQPK